MCLGIPGKILEIIPATQDSSMRMGKVQFGGVAKDVCLAYLPDAVVGDYVLVHVGFAISRLDEKEAGEIFSYIEQLDELSDMHDPFSESDPARDDERIENASEKNP